MLKEEKHASNTQEPEVPVGPDWPLSQKTLGHEALFWHVEPTRATSWLATATLFYTSRWWSSVPVDWDFLLSCPAILPSLDTDSKYYQFSKFSSIKISTLMHKGREREDYSRCSLKEYTEEIKHERNIPKEFPGQTKTFFS